MSKRLLVVALAAVHSILLAGEAPFALRYEPGDRYALTISHLAIHDLAKPAEGQPGRLVRTWDAKATLTFKEKDKALALTLEGLELTGTWDGGPLPKDLHGVVDRAIGKLEVLLPRQEDGSVRLPPDIEKQHSMATAIVECLLPILPEEPVAPGGLWRVNFPLPEKWMPAVLARSAGRGLYEEDVDYRQVAVLDGGWRPCRFGDGQLAKLTYTAARLDSIRSLNVYFARTQGVVVRSSMFTWRRPEHRLAILRDQQIVETHSLTRLRSPADGRRREFGPVGPVPRAVEP
ncbi:MAG: hypothetical protein FJ290_13820 [Planctomycetes bacterium]|nr:hypothetical protein [Planctomycetota bacterium]